MVTPPGAGSTCSWLLIIAALRFILTMPMPFGDSFFFSVSFLLSVLVAVIIGAYFFFFGF
jgi:hypothetical protein